MRTAVPGQVTVLLFRGRLLFVLAFSIGSEHTRTFRIDPQVVSRRRHLVPRFLFGNLSGMSAHPIVRQRQKYLRLEFKPLSTSETDLEEDDDTIGVAIEEGALLHQPLTTRAQLVEQQQGRDQHQLQARIEMVTLPLSSDQIPNNNNNTSQNNFLETESGSDNTTNLPTIIDNNKNNDDDDEGNAPRSNHGEKPSNSCGGKWFAGADSGGDNGEGNGALSTGTVDFDQSGVPGCCRARCHPRNMLADGRIRTNLFVYGLFSVMSGY